MLIESGYIKLWRSLTKWEWYSDINVKILFIHLLLTVNYEENKWQGISVCKGQRVVSIRKLSLEIGLTEKQIRVALSKLIKTGEVSSQGTNKYTVITVKNYTKFQCIENDNGKQEGDQEGKRETNGGQTGGKQRATKEERRRKIKKDKEYIYGEFENVKFTMEEYQKLLAKFPDTLPEKIEALSSYMESKGKRYSSHYATILSWARKDDKEKPDGKPKEETPLERSQRELREKIAAEKAKGGS